MDSLSVRQHAFNTHIIDASYGAFKRWGCILRYARDNKLNLIRQQLAPLPEDERLSQFRSIAGGLSGSECAYAQWTYNLFGDDPTRAIGQSI